MELYSIDLTGNLLPISQHHIPRGQNGASFAFIDDMTEVVTLEYAQL